MAANSLVLRVLLLAHLVMLALAAAATTANYDDHTTAITPSDEAKNASAAVLNLYHVASTLASITVSWNWSSPSNATADPESVSFYRVEAFNLATEVRLISPKLFANNTEYTLPDLAVDTQYEMCVVADGDHNRSACAVFGTIPVVRDDSIIALLLALVVLAIVVIIAIVLWRCAIRRSAAPDDDTGETPSDDKPEGEDEEKQGLNEKSPLLEPTAAEPVADSPPPSTDPAGTQPDASNQEQPQSLYLFLAGHAFK